MCNLRLHLLEVKHRVLLCASCFLVFFVAGFLYSDHIAYLALKPLSDALMLGDTPVVLIQTGVMELFFVHCKLAALLSTYATIPVVAYNLYAFCAPGLYRKEKQAMCALVGSALALCYLTLIFVYYAVLPIVCRFCVALNARYDSVTLTLKVQDYFSLLTSLFFGFTCAFHVPIAILALVLARIIKIHSLRRCRKYMIVVSLSIAAVLTPPDIVSQVVVALPMIILYEIVIALGSLLTKPFAECQQNVVTSNK